MSISVWFSSASKSDLRSLRRVDRTAERIIGTTLPTLQELYLSRVSKRAGKITLDPSHPAHSLFELLPSGRRYRVPSTRTIILRNSFFPQSNPSHEHLILNVERLCLYSTLCVLSICMCILHIVFCTVCKYVLSICKLLLFFLHCLEHAHKNFTHQGTCAVVM